MTTRRSHPPTLTTWVRRTLREEIPVNKGQRILCACSGGPDSTALLHSLAGILPKLGIGLVAHGVDHGLRAEASQELDGVEALCRSLGVPFGRSRINISPGSDLQARARNGRWEALTDAQEQARADFVATGHTADDRAETLVMRMLRGAGPAGLAVLPPRAEMRIRPMIRVRRSDVDLHVRRHRLYVSKDPSNQDRRFLRVKVRNDVMPMLCSLSPNIIEQLCGLADAMGQLTQDDPLAGFGRAQRELVLRARKLGRSSAQIRVSGGKDVEVRFANGELMLKEL